MAFIIEADYTPRIKAEIKQIVTGSTGGIASTKQVLAEDTAIEMIRQYIGSRYDCASIFAAAGNNRNKWIVKCVITIALYDMYHQTGMKDIPEHRVAEYEDVLEWLKKVGDGTRRAELPVLPETDTPTGDIRFNSRKPMNQKW